MVGITPNLSSDTYSLDPRAQAIAVAARELVEKRNLLLNPADLVEIVPEVVAGRIASMHGTSKLRQS
jgi:hypothetical protein